jgi:prophage regulatory protein
MSINHSLRPLRIMRADEVVATVGAAKSTIYMWIRAGKFPRPKKIGPRRVGWLTSDVEAWLFSRDAS